MDSIPTFIKQVFDNTYSELTTMTILKVRHHTTGEVMVMKINKDVTKTESEMRSRYKNAVRKEAELLTQLSHHNVLRLKGSEKVITQTKTFVSFRRLRRSYAWPMAIACSY